jgi:hypothetical protein
VPGREHNGYPDSGAAVLPSACVGGAVIINGDGCGGTGVGPASETSVGTVGSIAMGGCADSAIGFVVAPAGAIDGAAIGTVCIGTSVGLARGTSGGSGGGNAPGGCVGVGIRVGAHDSSGDGGSVGWRSNAQEGSPVGPRGGRGVGLCDCA